MNALFIMIPVTLVLSLTAMIAFIWATKSGQWDDLDLAPRKPIRETKPKKDEHAREQLQD